MPMGSDAIDSCAWIARLGAQRRTQISQMEEREKESLDCGVCMTKEGTLPAR